MNTTLRMLSAAAAMAGALALPAMAQEPARGKQAGDIVLGFGGIAVLPQDGGRVGAVGGRPHANNFFTPQLDLTWFATPNLSLNLIAATSRHDVRVTGSAVGDLELGRVWVLPPTLTVQYHPLPSWRFSPYVGAGLNYTIFYGEGGTLTSPVSKVDVKDAWGWALNAGLDVELSPRWVFNVDAKKLFLTPRVAVNSGAINARAELDPWVVGAGIRYRF